MNDAVRYFDFDRYTPIWAAMPVIVAALDDEGLVLLDANNATTSGITTVLVDGIKRFVVPTSRIAPRLRVVR